jgi:non-specific serine/threonine protein kinase
VSASPDLAAGAARNGAILAAITALKQICNHPAAYQDDGRPLTGRSGKLTRLEELVESVFAVGERLLIFTHFASWGRRLAAHLTEITGHAVECYDGDLSRTARDRMVTEFQTGKGPGAMVLSLKAGGTGLTLTAANHVVHVDRWWNPAVEDQATDRVFRIGQRKSVQVRKFVCAGTVEEKIGAMIHEKRGLAARIVGTGEQWLTELSTSQLAELFRLEAGAVVE